MIYRVVDFRNQLQFLNLAFSLLSDEKKAKLSIQKNQDAVARSVLGEFLVKQELAPILGVSINDIQFCYANHGKPYLKGNPMYFSISHSDVYLAYAVSKNLIGIDVEKNKTINPKISKKLCTECEMQFATDNTKLLNIWTAKEAFLKLSGDGIFGGLKTFSVADENGLMNQVGNVSFKHEQNQDFILSVAFKEEL